MLPMLIDALARRYGRLPHEILDLDPYALGVAIVSYQAGKHAEASALREATRGNGMVFPAVILASP